MAKNEVIIKIKQFDKIIDIDFAEDPFFTGIPTTVVNGKTQIFPRTQRNGTVVYDAVFTAITLT